MERRTSKVALPSYYFLCDRCHFKIRATRMRKTWEGYLTCEKCWEPRHPQDLIKIKPFVRQAKDVRPEPPDRFLSED